MFKRTPRYSTYLYAIIAGPYTFVEQKKDGFVPMRIYFRKSVMADVKPATIEEMFLATHAGMKYYNDLFGKPY